MALFYRTINVEEILSSVKASSIGYIWILAQSPIIHVYAIDLDSADRLIKKAVSSGFKNSGFKSIKKNIVIEISSTERIDAPIGQDGDMFCDMKQLELLVKISNDVFLRSQKKLMKFKACLDSKY